MFGQKKLSEIRAEIAAALKRSHKDPARWLEAKIAKLEKDATADSLEVETLMLIRDGLREAKAASGGGHRRAVGARRSSRKTKSS